MNNSDKKLEEYKKTVEDKPKNGEWYCSVERIHGKVRKLMNKLRDKPKNGE
jgi:hypothetical protein